MVSDSASITVSGREPGEPDYVSRGAHKLIGALDAFGIDVAGQVAMDAGASTGGFTDVLLRRGTSKVYCVDVGYGQLAWRVSQDPRVVQMDRTNVRSVDLAQLDGPVDLVVADLSFISLITVLPALLRVLADDGQMLLMVKPQFEVGRAALGPGAVVTDPHLRAEAVMAVAQAAYAQGLGTHGVVASPLPGPSGNVEYFLWLSRSGDAPQWLQVQQAVEEGPA
jgi:23S rRNA (cytidine1920-2'-O)/16S rRNA (cytidine1409-2'-O)-methyltransferase